MKKEKILVFSIALEGYSQLFKNCISSQREYCKKYDLDYVLVNKSPRKLLPTEAAWLKLFLLRAALTTNKYSWIAFIDADCEIRDFSPLFINDMNKYDDIKSVFMAHGFSGRINSGVILLKKRPGSLKYLNDVINNGDIPVPIEDEALYENGHMIHYGKTNPVVQILESVKWNNNQTIDEKSFIQHYSGGILREKYLKKHPFRKSYYKIRKRLKRYIYKFSSKETKTSMQEINYLIPYYTKTYQEFKIEN